MPSAWRRPMPPFCGCTRDRAEEMAQERGQDLRTMEAKDKLVLWEEAKGGP